MQTKSILTSFRVRAAPKSWLKYTTDFETVAKLQKNVLPPSVFELQSLGWPIFYHNFQTMTLPIDAKTVSMAI